MNDTPTVTGLRQVTLDDKYSADTGHVYLSGTQALVRLPLMQRRRDLTAGLNTAGYITGYRGSPIGAYDQALARAQGHLDTHHVKFVPGTNEDLAATALWGTQQLNLFPGARYDGVFGIWYGKGPGVDRSGDVLRHANQAGTAPHGGVIAIAGDDHAAKSSTMAAQTDLIFQAVSMPVLAPASLQDYLDLGLHGFALSRFSGLWIAIKSVTDTLETAGVVDVSLNRVKPVLPTLPDLPSGGLNIRWPESTFLGLEERLTRCKLPAALAYAAANRLDRGVFGRAGDAPARLGIISTGKAHLDLMQALTDLGIDQRAAERLGIKVYQVTMPWPLEPSGIARFIAGCDEVLVVEEKRPLIEDQLKAQQYGHAQGPAILGKADRDGAPLLPAWGELSPAMLARVIAGRLARYTDPVTGRNDDAQGGRDTSAQARIAARLALLDTHERQTVVSITPVDRIPYFCSGCPHNSSTKVPEGSRALAGIGCHYMAQWMDRETATFTHMGGEGMTWVGQAPFTDTPHVFQNLGDGTYFHSGSLAIRHAVATRTPITYKILFNDAVAMTGGQPHDGALTPQAIARQVRAEGVQRIVVVTDEPQKYPAGSFEADVQVHGREQLDTVQRALREHRDVSVLIFDQTCAAEKRRRRKRGSFPDPDKRVFINEAVCEGCGDCGVQSNCVSIEPVETEFGRKRTINQSACNKDFSCVNGFCPSFVTVEGGQLRKARGTAAASHAPAGEGQAGAVAGATGSIEPTLPNPVLPPLDDRAWSILVTGIGGTGVVTIGQLLGMAAHLEGKAVTVLDMAGLAQKNGAVMSFIRIAATADSLHAPRIGTAAADAVIGGDLVVTAGRDALSRFRQGSTRVVCNTEVTPTADFTRNPDLALPEQRFVQAIRAVAATEGVHLLDASRLATRLLGDAIAGNLMLLGAAWQSGLVPLSAQAIERAIELNAVAVPMNLRAFRLGRQAVVDAAAVEAQAAPSRPLAPARRLSTTLDETIARRVDFLTDYQDANYATRYRALVDSVRRAEAREGRIGTAGPGTDAASWPLTDAVARNAFKLMAYKDEYEVARLYTDEAFQNRLNDQFDGDYRLTFHLAPPLLARKNARGELIKQSYGPWMMTAFRWLARWRRLRGTALDPFGRTDERRAERQAIKDYESTVATLVTTLSRRAESGPEGETAERRAQRLAGPLAVAVEIAALPATVRGYGHVKARSLAAAQARERQLLASLTAPAGAPGTTLAAAA